LSAADLAHATLLRGTKSVIALAAMEMALAQVLAIIVSLWVGRWFIAITVALIIVPHVLYNIEPVRLKCRGIANPLTLGASLVFLPCLVSYATVRPDFTGPVWLIFAGLGASVTGRASWWMIPDLAADAATGTVTLAVRYGAVRMIVVACLIVAVVPWLLGWGLRWRYGRLALALALAGTVASGGFLAGQLPLLRRGHPSYACMRRRDMTPMMIDKMFLAIFPLTAPQGALMK
jgi:4-hydroxybenzoate polyprenyltransferase